MAIVVYSQSLLRMLQWRGRMKHNKGPFDTLETNIAPIRKANGRIMLLVRNKDTTYGKDTPENTTPFFVNNRGFAIRHGKLR